MTVIATVDRDVVVARGVAETIFSTRSSSTFRSTSFADVSNDSLPPRCLANISDCHPRLDGSCVLTVSVERSFVRRDGTDGPRALSVCMRWGVHFPPAYPAAPCEWRIVRRAAGAAVGDLRSFVVEDLNQCLEASSRPRRAGAERAGGGGGLRLASPFVVDVALLCGFWSALELDERCLVLAPSAGATATRGVSSLTATGSETGDDRREGGCDVRLMSRAGRNAVRRPHRAFAALMTPNGRAVVWGTPRSAHAYVDGAVRRSAGPSYAAVLRHAHAPQVLTLLAALPSCVETASTQFDTKHQLSDVCLWADDACGALRHNARLCTTTHALHSAAAALRLLRRLLRAAPPHQPELYAKKVLAPTLLRIVVGLQQRRQPFWAGVALCCVVLPGVLDERMPLSFTVASALIDYPECHGCVSLVTSVFAMAGSPLKYREAESVRGVMEKLWRDKVSSMALPFLVKAAPPQATATATTPEKQNSSSRSDSASLIPLTECAVCGLSLLRNGVFGDSDAGMKCTDDCLTVQCARCGHGGHVPHIIGWWEDRNVRCCPKGCDCLCIY